MANIYTSFPQVSIDTILYTVAKFGVIDNLYLYPAIARNRWPWFVENFSGIKQNFQAAAAGNERFLVILEDMEKQVEGYRLGNTNSNPFGRITSLSKFQPIVASIQLGTVNLTPEERRIVENERKRASELTEVDFRNMISFLRREAIRRSQEVGLSDPTVEQIYGIKSVPRVRSATIKDLQAINNINSTIKVVESFILSLQSSQKRPPNLLEKAQQNIETGSRFVPRNIYQTYIPVPFSGSLEEMARIYLGSAQRWYELVTVNNLQPPFYDPVGTKYDLVSPPSSGSVIISNAPLENIGPGVRVGIGSTAFPEEQRVIHNITINQDDTITVTLGGASDLSKFKPKNNGYIRVYKPHTVRNESYILIPSNESSSSSGGAAKKTPTKNELREMEKAFVEFGIDIARDRSTNDILLDSNGNFKLAYAQRAIEQAVLNALRTEKGELTYHSNFGVNYDLGKSYQGSANEALLVGDLLVSSIQRDRRFDSVKISKISGTKNTASLQLVVQIKGFNTPIPLNFVT